MRAWLWTALLTIACGAGCGLFDGGDPPPTARRGVGERCSDRGDCRVGLTCDETSTCQPPGDVAQGEACVFTGDCVEGLYCAADRTCTPAGDADVGETCATTADCIAGLTCALRGFYAECVQSGNGDTGDACTTAEDCLAGLACAGDAMPVCASPAPAPMGTELPPSGRLWPGVECPADSSQVKAYFEVPRFMGTDNDFYRLPYPNDIRRTDSGLDLRGHPAPDTAVEELDIIQRYIDAAETQNGFGLNPVGYFRFSAAYDWDTVPSNLYLIDVDPDSPTFGQEQGIAWLTTFGPISKYICENWVAARAAHGSPLRPGTTYAFIVKNGLRPHPDVGGSFMRDTDLDMLMADTAPSDPVLATAHAKYAPLRAFLADNDIVQSAEVLNATVFTTQERFDGIALRDAVHATAVPSARDVLECDAAVVSPCDDGTIARSCEGAPAASFRELHGRVSLPQFQEGTRPYATEGGGFVVSGGRPQSTGSEDVCFGLTVPNGTAPAGGWPVLIALHGTGGSFRTAVGNGLASAMASAGIATIAIDLPMHGARRGDDGSPDRLFFNFLNPDAAWGNHMQGAADLMGLVRFLVESGIETPEAIDFDPAQIGVFAHSQGATHASLALPFEPDVLGVVLSGSGGDLTLSLLTKESPIDIAGLLPYALLDPSADGKLATGDFHPALSLWQGFFDTVDPVNYAKLWNREFIYPKHLFMTFGVGDTFTTEDTMLANARAAGLPHITPHALELPLATLMPPISGNVALDMMPYTQVLRSYAPMDGDDGHFVATRTSAGFDDTSSFLTQLLGSSVPTLR